MKAARCEHCYLKELRVVSDGDRRYIECLACGAAEPISEEQQREQEVPA